MKLYDITQELLRCQVYPGDPAPQKETLCSLEQGDSYQLSAISLCLHNGTHVDAPAHFLPNGTTIDSIALDQFVGLSYVAEHNGVLTGQDAADILEHAKKQNPQAARRILIKGQAVVSLEAAKVFAEAKLLLVGNESQSVGPEDAPAAVHRVLLERNVVLLEGIRLSDVPEGIYLLNAAPLQIAGAEGSPCRAWLMSLASEERI